MVCDFTTIAEKGHWFEFQSQLKYNPIQLVSLNINVIISLDVKK